MAEGKYEETLAKADQLRLDGQYDEALKLYEECLAERPDDIAALYGRALVFNYTGEFERSLEELERIRDMAPNFVKARVHLGLTYTMLGMYEEGKKELKEVLKIDPGNPEALKHLSYFPDENGSAGEEGTYVL